MAHALTGTSWETSVAFGIDPHDVATIDNGRNRQAADYAQMEGVHDAGRKQTIIKTAGRYCIGARVSFGPLRSNAEIAASIKMHDAMLSKALQLGDASFEGLAPGVPCLSKNEAAAQAFVMLFGNWPLEKIVRVLQRIQSGTAIDGEGGDKAPLYVVREMIDAKQRGHSIQAVKQIGLILNAAIKAETGQTASARVLRAEIAKELPTPMFSVLDLQVAA
jgi:hypothetical protein